MSPKASKPSLKETPTPSVLLRAIPDAVPKSEISPPETRFITGIFTGFIITAAETVIGPASNPTVELRPMVSCCPMKVSKSPCERLILPLLASGKAVDPMLMGIGEPLMGSPLTTLTPPVSVPVAGWMVILAGLLAPPDVVSTVVNCVALAVP